MNLLVEIEHKSTINLLQFVVDHHCPHTYPHTVHSSSEYSIFKKVGSAGLLTFTEYISLLHVTSLLLMMGYMGCFFFLYK